MIQYYKNGIAYKLDPHWRPQTLLCYPCHLNYTFVLKFENLYAESNQLLNYIQRNDKQTNILKKIVFPKYRKPSTTRSVTRKTMQQISEKLVKILRRIYADDFRLFGYDPYLYKGA